MNINDRIEKIKPYFMVFNISAEEDAAYVVVKFPSTWTVPDTKALLETYKVQTAPMENGMCFATEIKNGAECVFDAIDYIVEFNKRIEERRGLLQEKLEEFKKLFATESLDRLKTLKFVFDDTKKVKRTTKKADKPAVVEPTEAKEETEGADDNSLMSFAKNITED